MSQSEWCQQCSADINIDLSIVTRRAFSPIKRLAHDTTFPNPRDGLLVYTTDRVVKILYTCTLTFYPVRSPYSEN